MGVVFNQALCPAYAVNRRGFLTITGIASATTILGGPPPAATRTLPRCLRRSATN